MTVIIQLEGIYVQITLPKKDMNSQSDDKYVIIQLKGINVQIILPEKDMKSQNDDTLIPWTLVN